MIKGVIFDFDGVIVDTESRKFKDLKKILRAYKHDLKNELFHEMVGKKTSFFLASIYQDMPEKTLEAIIAKRRKMQSLSIESYKLIPGIRKLLDFLKSKKYLLAIATGSEKIFVRKVLKQNSIDKYFDIIVSGESFKSSKPNPECYDIALKKLGLSPSKVVIIEDSVAGVKAGKAAGCRVFAIMTYSKKKVLSTADKVFRNHLEILDYLKLNAE